ncbi:MAG: response regulator transcription factor [Rhodoferax sp.]|nr:response regulator transcription factor [Rhodoferax sp.]
METSPTVHVALVDDDAHYRSLFSDSIARHGGMAVDYAATSGEDMMAWLQSHRPDVLLVDLGLPGASGLDVVRFGAKRWPQMPMGVVTLFSDEPNVISCLEAGATGYILKQTSPLEIAPVVQQMVDGHAPMSPSIARYVLQRLRQSTSHRSTKPLPPEVALTPREHTILNHIARGFRVAEVAQQLDLQATTVSSHLKKIYEKLSVHSKTEAVYEAVRMGLILPPSSH